MTTIEEVQSQVDRIAKRMSAKGLITPEATVWVKGSGLQTVYLSWKQWDTGGRYNADAEAAKFLSGQEVDAALALAAAFVEAMPDKEDRDLAEFTAKVAEAVEFGRKIGADIGPLMAAMEALSKNVIEHKP